MKKLMITLLAIALLTAVAGCNRTTGNQSGANAPTENPQVSQPDETDNDVDENLIADEADTTFTISDEHVEILLTMAKQSYTVEEPVDIHVKVSNVGDAPLVYVVGSGSNTVPDALQLDLGGFAPMFRPLISTNDYRTELLQPGDSIDFDCPVAPYIPLEGVYAYGDDGDLDFFRDEEQFTPAEPGEVKGNLQFSYTPVAEDADPEQILLTDDEDLRTLSIEFTTVIDGQGDVTVDDANDMTDQDDLDVLDNQSDPA